MGHMQKIIIIDRIAFLGLQMTSSHSYTRKILSYSAWQFVKLSSPLKTIECDHRSLIQLSL